MIGWRLEWAVALIFGERDALELGFYFHTIGSCGTGHVQRTIRRDGTFNTGYWNCGIEVAQAITIAIPDDQNVINSHI